MSINGDEKVGVAIIDYCENFANENGEVNGDDLYDYILDTFTGRDCMEFIMKWGECCLECAISEFLTNYYNCEEIIINGDELN